MAAQPASVTTLTPPTRAWLPGAPVRTAVIGSPASEAAVIWPGGQGLQGGLLRRRCRSVDPPVGGSSEAGGQLAVELAGVPPPMTRPSLSVVHTDPSRRT